MPPITYILHVLLHSLSGEHNFLTQRPNGSIFCVNLYNLYLTHICHVCHFTQLFRAYRTHFIFEEKYMRIMTFSFSVRICKPIMILHLSTNRESISVMPKIYIKHLTPVTSPRASATCKSHEYSMINYH